MRKTLVVFLLIAAGAVFFLYWLAPWRGLLDSDHAVPYLMTRSPWRLYDLYYWRAVRFGSVYVSLWKAVAAPFITSAAPFYVCHALLFFSGLGLWLLALRHPLSRGIFLWTCLPLTTVLAYHFLFPGQLYGMLFFLMGALFLLLEKRPEATAALGIVSGVVFWQHELAGLLCLLVAGGAQLPWRSGRDARRLLPLALGFAPVLALAELARHWAARIPVDKHYVLENMSGWWHNLVDFAHRGLPFFGDTRQGYFLLLALALIGWLAAKEARKGLGRLDGASLAFFAGALGCIAIINLSHHYVENERADRYYAFLVPATLFLFLRRAEETARANHRRIYLFLVAIATAALTHSRPAAWTIRAPLRASRAERLDRATATLASLQADGCPSYLGAYWEAYLLSPLSDGKLEVSAWDHVRNFELFDRLRDAPRFCASLSLAPEMRDGKIYGATCTNKVTHFTCSR